jgi:uncharacterized membrane protein YedE/YeeE
MTAIPVTPTPSRRIVRAAPARKPKTNQLPYAAAVLALAAAGGVYLALGLGNSSAALVWVLGIGFGLTLQRSRFCFTASMRDPLLTGSTSITKAVILGIAVATVGFALVQWMELERTANLSAAMKLGSLEPLSASTVVGGILFGIGAVIAGGCASGTLMRMGEGFVQQWLVFPFFVVGSAVGAASWPWWKEVLFVDPANVVYLPKALGGFGPALAAQAVLLALAWVAADWWGKRKTVVKH